MDSFVLSDLHIGVEDPESLFAGAAVLPRFLDKLVQRPAPVRLILNGDTFDFLVGEGEPVLHPQEAAAAMQRLVQSDIGEPLLRSLGLLLARQGEVLIRLGNHDLELALPAVQAILRSALRQPAHIASRLVFTTGERPLLLDLGGTRTLITHGEHDDPFNRIDYAKLLPIAAATPDAVASAFPYPAGSLLMRRIVSPLRRKYELRFLDFLKPDFQGAVLVALAVAPEACLELFQAATWDIGWQLLRSSGAGFAFATGDGAEPELGLAERVDDSGLLAAERDELAHFLGGGEHGVSFAAGGLAAGLSERIRAKLLVAGLSLYARAHRAVAGRAGADFFRIDPGPAELEWAAQLAQRYDVHAVLTGHTHAARFSCSRGCLYINSGTWIWLMRLPEPEAGLEEWSAFLRELRDNPMLRPDRQRLARPERLLSVITACPRPEGGARFALAECQEDGALEELRAAELPPSQLLRPDLRRRAHV